MATIRILLLDGADMFPFVSVQRQLGDPRIELSIVSFQRDDRFEAAMADAASKADTSNVDIVIVGHRGGRGATVAGMLPDDFPPERVLLVAAHDDIDTSAYPTLLNLKPWRYNRGAARRLVFMIEQLLKSPQRTRA